MAGLCPVSKGGRGYFWEIILVDLICKMVAVILDHHLETDIKFHDVLRVFWTNRRKRTASLRSNIIKHLVKMR